MDDEFDKGLEATQELEPYDSQSLEDDVTPLSPDNNLSLLTTSSIHNNSHYLFVTDNTMTGKAGIDLNDVAKLFVDANTFQKLSLAMCNLTADDLKILLRIYQMDHCQINELSLGYNPNIRSNFDMINAILRLGISHLTSVNLNRMIISENQMNDFIDIITDESCLITRIILDYCNIGIVSLSLLLTELAKIPEQKRLFHLSFNGMALGQTAAMDALANYLTSDNCSLGSLSLVDTSLTLADANQLVMALNNNESLTALDVSGTRNAVAEAIPALNNALARISLNRDQKKHSLFDLLLGSLFKPTAKHARAHETPTKSTIDEPNTKRLRRH